MSLTSTAKQLSYKQLQAALKTAKAEGLTSIKLNAKQSVLQAEYDCLQVLNPTETDTEYVNTEVIALASVTVTVPVEARLNNTIESSSYPFCPNTIKVENNATTTRVLPAMNSRYAPSWLCKPVTVYVVDGVDYLIHELEMQLKGQVCELPAAANERKLQANLPPRLQPAARKDRVSKARPAVPIVNVSKDLPKVACNYSKEPASPYFIDTHHNRFTDSLGSTERQAMRNVEDAVRSTTSATKRGIGAIISIVKGFHARQVERTRKAA